MRLELETRRFYLGREYSEAVEASGGLPIHIPLIPDEQYIAGVVAGLDGILTHGIKCQRGRMEVTAVRSSPWSGACHPLV